MKASFTQGCDPEFCLRDSRTERYLSAIPFVTGTKKEPLPMTNGAYVMRDNVAIEFGITPAQSPHEWVTNINQAIKDMATILPDYCEIHVIPSANFSKQQLLHPEAQEAGCDPDYNAWTNTKNKPPEDFADQTLRSFGGHLHTGYIEGSGNGFLLTDEGRLRTIRMFDAHHGMASTILDNSPEAIARKQLYGKAGCFRRTSYGVEYRTLSNFWCKSDKLKQLMFSLTGDVLRAVRANEDKYIIDMMGGGDEIQRVINEYDEKTAKVNMGIILQSASDETRKLWEVCYE